MICSGIPRKATPRSGRHPTPWSFGRPKGNRGSYKQWEEAGIAPQVVFEILSPGNRFHAMQQKFQFYEKHGVEEYYIYDPDDGALVAGSVGWPAWSRLTT